MVSRRVQTNPRDRIETGSWRTVARPTDWAARVQQVKLRDRVCQWVEHGRICGSGQDLECDHVGDPSDHDLSNLRMLCREHHQRRTNAQKAAGTRAYHAKRRRKRTEEPHPGLLDNT